MVFNFVLYLFNIVGTEFNLASVLDLHTKKVVGHKFSCTMKTEIVIDAVKNAVNAQKPAAGLIIVHTDLGLNIRVNNFNNS